MKNTFILYTDWMKQLEILSMEQRGILFTAIMCYQREEALPDMDGVVNMAFSFICADMERNNAKYEAICEKRKAAGLKGGRPKKDEERKAEILKEALALDEKQKKQKVIEENKKSKSFEVPYQEIVDYLNEACGTRYTSKSKATQRLIKARFNEGYSLEDFKQVIDTKAEEWLGDAKMNQFLRPETLFGTKFEGYLNKKDIKVKKNENDHIDANKKMQEYLKEWEDI